MSAEPFLKAIILPFLIGYASASAAKQLADQAMPAKILEADEYEPCDYYCGPSNHPVTAYCMDVGGQILVGERAGFLWLGESDAVSMRNLVGKEVSVRVEQGSILATDQSGRTIKIKRGSGYEGFADQRCVVEVHKPKLAIAARSSRPADIPADAFPLAGAQEGNIQNRSLFVWFSCSMSPDSTTIDCRKWYPHGASRGIERYCARTTQGSPVSADFKVDPLASREGRIVLTSGVALQFDHRGRTNDQLSRPGEACR